MSTCIQYIWQTTIHIAVMEQKSSCSYRGPTSHPTQGVDFCSGCQRTHCLGQYRNMQLQKAPHGIVLLCNKIR